MATGHPSDLAVLGMSGKIAGASLVLAIWLIPFSWAKPYDEQYQSYVQWATIHSDLEVLHANVILTKGQWDDANLTRHNFVERADGLFLEIYGKTGEARGESEKDVPVVDPRAEHLIRKAMLRAGDGLLFPNEHGKAYNDRSWRDPLKTIMAHCPKIRRGMTMYWVRHTFINRMMDAGLPTMRRSASALRPSRWGQRRSAASTTQGRATPRATFVRDRSPILAAHSRHRPVDLFRSSFVRA